MFVTGGIGDVIALSCFLDVPETIETVFYATRKRDDVEAFVSTLCPASTKHVSAWDDWSERWCFHSLGEYVRTTGRNEIADADDWSIATQFPRDLPFRGLPWNVGHPLSSIHKIDLPERYAVFQPFSCDKRDPHRDFNREEIKHVVEWSERHGLLLVLLNSGNDEPITNAPNLIDLQNRTNIFGSIDVTLGAAAYIGIDSAMSQVATKVLPSHRLAIKSTNIRPGHGHYYKSLHWYAAPHTSFPFVGTDPIELLKRLDVKPT